MFLLHLRSGIVTSGFRPSIPARCVRRTGVSASGNLEIRLSCLLEQGLNARERRVNSISRTAVHHHTAGWLCEQLAVALKAYHPRRVVTHSAHQRLMPSGAAKRGRRQMSCGRGLSACFEPNRYKDEAS